MPHHRYDGLGYGHDTHGFAATHDYHPDIHLALAGDHGHDAPLLSMSEMYKTAPSTN